MSADNRFGFSVECPFFWSSFHIQNWFAFLKDLFEINNYTIEPKTFTKTFQEIMVREKEVSWGKKAKCRTFRSLILYFSSHRNVICVLHVLYSHFFEWDCHCCVSISETHFSFFLFQFVVTLDFWCRFIPISSY